MEAPLSVAVGWKKDFSAIKNAISFMRPIINAIDTSRVLRKSRFGYSRSLKIWILWHKNRSENSLQKINDHILTNILLGLKIFIFKIYLFLRKMWYGSPWDVNRPMKNLHKKFITDIMNVCICIIASEKLKKIANKKKC